MTPGAQHLAAIRNRAVMLELQVSIDRERIAEKHGMSIGMVERMIRRRGRKICASCENETFTTPTLWPLEKRVIEACEECRPGILRGGV